MATGTGTATLTFANAPQAAQFATTKGLVTSTPVINTINASITGLTEVAFGGGRFVGVKESSTIAGASTDGVTWTLGTLPASLNWVGLAYGNGIFVTLASGSSFAYTSTDGITWATRTLPGANAWVGVAYGNGLFLVIDNNGVAASSADGINWAYTGGVINPASTFYSILGFGNGRFHAGARAVASLTTDGVTWTSRGTGASTNTWSGIVYGEDRLVYMALSAGASAVYTDAGVLSALITIPTSTTWKRITYGNKYFVAVTNIDSRVAVSLNGLSWELTELPGGMSFSAIAYGIGMFVLVGPSNIVVMTTLPLTAITDVSTEISPYKPVVGSNDASVTVTGLTTFAATDNVEVWLMGNDSTSAHNAMEHALAPIKLRISNPIAGVGFTINASSQYRLDGDFKVRYVWAS